MRARVCLLGLASVLLVAVVMIPARAKEPDRISVQTVYLRNPIEGFHHITITGELDGQGTLDLSPNTCNVNEFGDPTVCTAIGGPTIKVTIKDTKRSDPSKRRRKLYAVEGAGLKTPFFLVISPDADQPPRLVYKQTENAATAVTLEPLVISKKEATRARE